MMDRGTEGGTTDGRVGGQAHSHSLPCPRTRHRWQSRWGACLKSRQRSLTCLNVDLRPGPQPSERSPWGATLPPPGGGQSHNPVPGWAWLPGPGSEERMMRLRQLGCARGTPSPCTRACMTHAHGHPSQDLQRGHRVQRADHSQGCSVPELPGREVPGHRGLLHPAHLLPG